MVIAKLFRQLDESKDGYIGFDELFEFVRGRRHSLDQRSKRELELRLELPLGAMLEQVAWDVESLRILIKQMLERCHANPADLVRKWQGARMGLQRKPFVQKVQESFFKGSDAELWTSEVEPVAHEAFTQLLKMVPGREGGSNLLKRISVVHIQRWLDAPPVVRPAKPNGEPCGDVPLKSRKQMRELRRRRAKLSGAVDAEDEAERVAEAHARSKAANEAIAAGVAARAQAAIDAATEAKARRLLEAAAAEAERKELWERSRAPQHNGQRWELPPLQRWEMPQPAEPPKLVSGALRITRRTHKLWVSDHTRLIFTPIDNTVRGLMSKRAAASARKAAQKSAAAELSAAAALLAPPAELSPRAFQLGAAAAAAELALPDSPRVLSAITPPVSMPQPLPLNLRLAPVYSADPPKASPRRGPMSARRASAERMGGAFVLWSPRGAFELPPEFGTASRPMTPLYSIGDTSSDSSMA